MEFPLPQISSDEIEDYCISLFADLSNRRDRPTSIRLTQSNYDNLEILQNKHKHLSRSNHINLILHYFFQSLTR